MTDTCLSGDSSPSTDIFLSSNGSLYSPSIGHGISGGGSDKDRDNDEFLCLFLDRAVSVASVPIDVETPSTAVFIRSNLLEGTLHVCILTLTPAFLEEVVALRVSSLMKRLLLLLLGF
eukprot:gene36130-46974_t